MQESVNANVTLKGYGKGWQHTIEGGGGGGGGVMVDDEDKICNQFVLVLTTQLIV